MKAKVGVVLFFALFSTDILFEIFYQWKFNKEYKTVIAGASDLNKLLDDSMMKTFIKNIHHSIEHTISHLTNHWILLIVSALFLLLILSENVCKKLSEKLQGFSFTSISSCCGLSCFEVTIMQIEHAFIIYYEFVSNFTHFLGNNILTRAIWLILVVFCYVPLHVRAKILLETKLHYVAPITMAGIFSLARFIYKYVKFRIDNEILMHANSICLSFSKLKEFCDSKNWKVSFYNIKDPHYESACESLNYIFGKKVFIYGDITKFSNAEIEAALIHECCSFNFGGILDSLIFPVVEKFLFAGICIFLAKRYLKRFCSKNIGHITAFLVFEEFLAMGLTKFIFFPLRIYGETLIRQADDVVKSMGFGNEYAKFLLISEPSAHLSHVNPSFFYRIFNRETNLLERVKNLASFSSN